MAGDISRNVPVEAVIVCGLCPHPRHVGRCPYVEGYTSTSVGCICNVVPIWHDQSITDDKERD